jgi:hypothetical protein
MATMLTASQQGLVKALAKQQARLNLLERYYDGDAPLPEGAEGQSRAFRRFQRKARLNMAQLSVAAVRERMIIAGFRTGADGDENGDIQARRLWKANNMDVKSADLHNAFLKFGTAYALVGPPDAQGIPVVTIEDPRQMYATTSATDDRTILEAVKVFTEGMSHMAFFYYADRIEVFTKDNQTSIYDADNWMLVETMSAQNPLGEVPVVKYTNMDEKGEFEPYLDIIDRINHMTLQRLVIATTQAFRQRVLKGDFPTHDQDGNEIDYNGIFESQAGSLWMVPENADVMELGQADINGILQAVRADIQDFAAVTRTPMHYLNPEGANGSAEGAALAREGLVFKAEDRIARASSGWSKVMSLMFRWIGDNERASLLDLEPLWKPAERYSMSERADANSKFQDIPFRSRMSLIGQFSPAEIAQMEVERAGEQLLIETLTGTAVATQDGEAPTALATEAQQAQNYRAQAEALGAFIRAGVTPETASRVVGLSDLEFIDALPITLKPNNLVQAETEVVEAQAGAANSEN